MRSAWASACSWLSLPFSTSLAVWRCVTSRAFSSPASTYLESTSLSRTGTSADAITWAISPPMTPAPTTAALKTNMPATLASAPSPELPLGRQLDGEARDRTAQGLAHAPAQEQPLHRRERELGLERELERHARLLQAGLEDHPAHAREPLVLDLQRLAEPRLVARDPLPVAPGAARRRVPLQRAAGQRPVLRERHEMTEAVDPGGPARLVVPQLLGLDSPPADDDARLHGAHQGASRRGGDTSQRARSRHVLPLHRDPARHPRRAPRPPRDRRRGRG